MPTGSPSMSAASRPISSSGTRRWARSRRCSLRWPKKAVDLRMVNLGGGFPARYRAEVNSIEAYCEAVGRALVRHFGNRMPEVHHRARPLHGGRRGRDPERGRSGFRASRPTTASAGSTSTSASSRDWPRPWARASSTGCAPAVTARAWARWCWRVRPATSADILYEKTEYKMPLSLKPGDKVEILSTGAYTTTYSSVAFNGFAPLRAICI